MTDYMLAPGFGPAELILPALSPITPATFGPSEDLTPAAADDIGPATPPADDLLVSPAPVEDSEIAQGGMPNPGAASTDLPPAPSPAPEPTSAPPPPPPSPTAALRDSTPRPAPPAVPEKRSRDPLPTRGTSRAPPQDRAPTRDPGPSNTDPTTAAESDVFTITLPASPDDPTPSPQREPPSTGSRARMGVSAEPSPAEEALPPENAPAGTQAAPAAEGVVMLRGSRMPPPPPPARARASPPLEAPPNDPMPPPAVTRMSRRGQSFMMRP